MVQAACMLEPYGSRVLLPHLNHEIRKNRMKIKEYNQPIFWAHYHHLSQLHYSDPSEVGSGYSGLVSSVTRPICARALS